MPRKKFNFANPDDRGEFLKACREATEKVSEEEGFDTAKDVRYIVEIGKQFTPDQRKRNERRIREKGENEFTGLRSFYSLRTLRKFLYGSGGNYPWAGERFAKYSLKAYAAYYTTVRGRVTGEKIVEKFDITFDPDEETE